MADINDYSHEMTQVACSVMLELVRLLGEYRNDMRIIGGWMPELLVSREDERDNLQKDAFEQVNYFLERLGYMRK
ncbi:MAG: hypothetical protein AB9903_14285 [Vulcanimicrobiota bacterium]